MLERSTKVSVDRWCEPVETAFCWDVSLNGAGNEYASFIDRDVDTVFSTTNGGSVAASPVGGGGAIFGTDFQRNENGDVIVNNEGIPLIKSDRNYLGNYQPDWIGGLSIALDTRTSR